MACFGTYAQGAACDVVNGGFDDDGHLPDLSVADPNGWTSVVPKPQFSAYVFRDWATDGVYNLTMLSELGKNFKVGDTVMVSQQIDLSAAETLTFDVKLAELGGLPWDTTEATAMVMIDGAPIWDSNDLGPDPRGEYRDQVIIVDAQYRTAGLHTLSLALRINVEARIWKKYAVYIDGIALSCFCNGGGLLVGDFNADCVVDANDLAALAEVYLLDADPDDARNLWTDDDIEGDGGVVSLYDFAVLAGLWDGGFEALGTIAAAWLQNVDLTDPANLYDGDDVQPAANINFKDFALMAQNWMLSSWIEETTP